MTLLKKRAIIFLIGGACLAGLVTLWSFRFPFINAARADLHARGLYRIQIIGTRVPCSGMLDIGVAVVFRNSDEGEALTGRLCRRPDWSSEWKWYPDR